MNCNLSSLAPYVPSATNPWDSKKVTHLYKRLTAGAPPSLINDGLTTSPSAIIDKLFDDALDPMVTPITPPADWAIKSRKEYEDEGLDFDDVNGENMRSWQIQFFEDLRSNGLRERMTLFWSNHFVTEKNTYSCGRYMVTYYDTLQRNALGNFKDFVHDIGLTDAMLAYLNGFENTKDKPNENYARELFELFTLGEENEDIEYTQQDILETSRALTGYNDRKECDPDVQGECRCQPIVFNPDKFDTGSKTIFGQTGPWDYSDAIDILFNQKPLLIAKFIMGKLYKYFVSPEINETIVNDLAQEFFDAGFNLVPPLKMLFKSEHFFDDDSIGTLIKSPLDYYVNFLNVTQFPLKLNVPVMPLMMGEEDKGLDLTNVVFNSARAIGQELFQPVDVAGWQGDYDWLNTSSLIIRWESLQRILNDIFRYNDGEGSELFRKFALEISSSITIDISDGNLYSEQLVRNIIHAFIPQGLNSLTDYEMLISTFKEVEGVQPQYYTDGTWNVESYELLPSQVQFLFIALIGVPEFQLN